MKGIWSRKSSEKSSLSAADCQVSIELRQFKQGYSLLSGYANSPIKNYSLVYTIFNNYRRCAPASRTEYRREIDMAP